MSSEYQELPLRSNNNVRSANPQAKRRRLRRCPRTNKTGLSRDLQQRFEAPVCAQRRRSKQAHLVSHSLGYLSQMRLFERADGRVYAMLDPGPDLLGSWVVQTYRGGRYKRGTLRTFAAGTEAEALAISCKLAKLRSHHGYIEQPDADYSRARVSGVR